MDVREKLHGGRASSACDSYSGLVPEVQLEYSCAIQLLKQLVCLSLLPSPNSRKCFFPNSVPAENAKTRLYARISFTTPHTIW